MVNQQVKQMRIEVVGQVVFIEEDHVRLLYPQDGTLVITLRVANYTTHRIMIYNRSSADILFWDTF